MTLKATYATLEEIPETYRELYTERGGKFEITGIEGIQTSASTTRLEAALRKERDDHKATKAALGQWGEHKPEDVLGKLDRIAELEELAKGKVDEGKLDELAQRRAAALMQSKLGPLERTLAQKARERDEFEARVKEMTAREVKRTIHDKVRAALTGAKARSEAHEDALLLAERVFEVDESGQVVTRADAGVAQGLDPAAWLMEIQDRRPHWWPESVGGGARGSSGGTGMTGRNPFTAENWNATEQARMYREKGAEYAERLAKAAGTTVGGPRPAPRRAASGS